MAKYSILNIRIESDIKEKIMKYGQDNYMSVTQIVTWTFLYMLKHEKLPFELSEINTPSTQTPQKKSFDPNYVRDPDTGELSYCPPAKGPLFYDPVTGHVLPDRQRPPPKPPEKEYPPLDFAELGISHEDLISGIPSRKGDLAAVLRKWDEAD